MRTRDWVSAGAGGAAIAAAIFAVGGAPRWAQALVALIAAVAVVPLVPSRRVLGRISPLVAMLLIAIGLTVLQLVPLPHALVEWLQPGSALRDDGATLAGVSPSSTLTLDQPGTLRALAFFVILLGVAIVALRVAVTENGRYRILAAVGALCGLAAIVGGLHNLVGATSLYGLYRPQVLPQVLGPLLSSNHFGCLMAIGAIVTLSLALYRRQPPWLRVTWLVAMGACMFALLSTYSRGAFVALCVGGFVALGALVAQKLLAHETPRRRRAGFLTSSLPIAVVAACTVIVVLYAGAEGVAQQLSSTSLDELHAPRSKFAAWRSGVTLIEESPWVGVGRGAMEPVLTRVHPAAAYAAYSHLENEYLQAAVDFGVPGALLLGGTAAWLVIVALRRWRDGPLAAGGLGALAVVMLQSNVDFGVEVLGVAVPITAIAATLAYVPVREAKPKTLQLVRALRGVHVAALVILAALLLSGKTTYLDEDHLTRAASLDDVRGPIERHPLDYYNYAVAADALQRAGDPRAIHFLNHALVLHPTSPALHLDAAHLLYATGHADQATIEYAAALLPTRDVHKLLAEIATRFPPPQAAAAIPTDAIRADQITRELEELRHVDIAVAWLSRVLDLQPHTPHACELLYALATKQGDPAIVAVAAKRCADYPPGRDVRLALGKILLAKHDETEIVRLLGDVETWQGRSDEKSEAWLVLCDAQLALAYWDEAKRCLRRLDAAGLLPPERASEIAKRLEQIQEAIRSAPAH
jgi:O-antigen ligase